MGNTQTEKIYGDARTDAETSVAQSTKRQLNGPLRELTAIEAILTRLVLLSTDQRLPAGHWLIVCPEDLLAQLVEAIVLVQRTAHDVRRAIEMLAVR